MHKHYEITICYAIVKDKGYYNFYSVKQESFIVIYSFHMLPVSIFHKSIIF